MKVTKDTIIGQVLMEDQNTAKVFMMNGMFCIGCPHSQGESIEDAAAAHGINADTLVEALNKYFEEKE